MDSSLGDWCICDANCHLNDRPSVKLGSYSRSRKLVYSTVIEGDRIVIVGDGSHDASSGALSLGPGAGARGGKSDTGAWKTKLQNAASIQLIIELEIKCHQWDLARKVDCSLLDLSYGTCKRCKNQTDHD